MEFKHTDITPKMAISIRHEKWSIVGYEVDVWGAFCSIVANPQNGHSELTQKRSILTYEIDVLGPILVHHGQPSKISIPAIPNRHKTSK